MVSHKRNTDFRGKYFSLVLQPKVDHTLWATGITNNQIEKLLMNSGYPLWTEVEFILNNFKAESATTAKKLLNPTQWAFGTETSTVNFIPHYQIYIEFDVLIRKTSIFEQLNQILGDRAHIAVKKVFSEDYKIYCLKPTDFFSFSSSYYWNVKRVSTNSIINKNEILILRPRLEMIKNNYYTGQKLLLKAVQEEPDDRTAIWFADVLGCTGKTSFFQTIISDPALNGVFLKISDGQERLSAKFRKKIESRLVNGRGYPKFCWINFGRTVTESNLKTFADFGEQILDGMLDDNFGNTGGEDFTPLPYMNLFITANTPPNLKLLTGDRLKLVTLVPIRNIERNINDAVLLPVYVEINVRISRFTQNSCRYRYKVRVQDKDFAKQNFSRFSWYPELLENMDLFHTVERPDIFSSSTGRGYYEASGVDSNTFYSKWKTEFGSKLNEDILELYVDAMDFMALTKDALIVETSNFNLTKPKVIEWQKKSNP